MIGKVTLGSSGSGGLDINGIIEQYKVMAGKSVATGDFVKYIQGSGELTEKTLSQSYTIDSKDILAISENQIVYLYTLTNTSSSSYTTTLYAVGISWDTNGISFGTPLNIYNNSNYLYNCNLTKTNDGRFLVALRRASGDTEYTMIALLSIDANNLITMNAAPKNCFSTSGRWGGCAYTVMTTDNEGVLFSYSWATSPLEFIKFQIQNNSIQTIGDKQSVALSWSEMASYPGYYHSDFVKYGNKIVSIFTAQGTSGNYRDFVPIVALYNIDSNTATLTKLTNLIAIDIGAQFLINIYDNKFIFIDPSSDVRVTVFEMENDNFVLKKTTIIGLSISELLGAYFDKDEQLLHIFSVWKTDKAVYDTSISISGNDCLVNGSTKILTTKPYRGSSRVNALHSMIGIVGNEYVAVFESSSTIIYAAVMNSSSGVSPVMERLDTILGVANQSGTSGQTVDVYIPEAHKQ